jgi:hypothetical protein
MAITAAEASQKAINRRRPRPCYHAKARPGRDIGYIRLSRWITRTARAFRLRRIIDRDKAGTNGGTYRHQD